MLTVLSTTMGRVPTGVMRAKFGAAVVLLSDVVGEAREQVRGGAHDDSWHISGDGTKRFMMNLKASDRGM
jgi:hypothetical protein